MLSPNMIVKCMPFIKKLEGYNSYECSLLNIASRHLYDLSYPFKNSSSCVRIDCITSNHLTPIHVKA